MSDGLGATDAKDDQGAGGRHSAAPATGEKGERMTDEPATERALVVPPPPDGALTDDQLSGVHGGWFLAAEKVVPRIDPTTPPPIQ
jgi:hypothetical protein